MKTYVILIGILALVLLTACTQKQVQENNNVQQTTQNNDYTCLSNADCTTAYGSSYSCDTDLNQCVLN